MNERARNVVLGEAPAPDSTSDVWPAVLSRRDVLRGAAWGGVAIFLAACGSTASPSPSAAAASVGTPSAPPGPSSTPPPASPSARPSSSAPPAPAIDLAHKIAGLMVVGFRGSTLAAAPWVGTALAKSGLGGVILFDRDQLTGGSRNVLGPSHAKRLPADLRPAAPHRRALVR